MPWQQYISIKLVASTAADSYKSRVYKNRRISAFFAEIATKTSVVLPRKKRTMFVPQLFHNYLKFHFCEMGFILYFIRLTSASLIRRCLLYKWWTEVPRCCRHRKARLWIEETNDLVAIDTEISLNLKGLVAIKIATAVRKKNLAAVAIAIWFFETHPRRERELDR